MCDYDVVHDGILVLHHGPDRTEEIQINEDIREILEIIDINSKQIVALTKHKGRDESYLDIIEFKE